MRLDIFYSVNDSMLELENVNVFIGPLHILRDISIRLGKGEIVALLGRNGAGKTTTIKSILGIVPVKSGKIKFKGQDITNLPPHKVIKLGIGYSPEDARIFSDLTTDENIKIAIWSSGIATLEDMLSVKEQIYNVFPEVKRLMERRGFHLSGGERKMVSIARALALRPSLLLLDEAFEGLAPIVRARLSEAVRRIKELGISMLIAESNIAFVSDVADRAYVMDRGEIIYEGSPIQILKNEEIMKLLALRI